MYSPRDGPRDGFLTLHTRVHKGHIESNLGYVFVSTVSWGFVSFILMGVYGASTATPEPNWRGHWTASRQTIKIWFIEEIVIVLSSVYLNVGSLFQVYFLTRDPHSNRCGNLCHLRRCLRVNILGKHQSILEFENDYVVDYHELTTIVL